MNTWMCAWVTRLFSAARRPLIAGLLALLVSAATAAGTAEEVRGLFEKPGLVADPEARTVRIAAESTAVRAREPMEFFLVHRRSGHDYEAFAITDVLPSDIHRALRHIGLEPGRGIDYDRLHFWPSGPRVSVQVEEPSGPDGERLVYGAEETVLDQFAGEALPRSGFVFTGSIRLHDDERLDGDGYAADVLEPHAVITFFNLPTTVLDVPRRAPQGDVYDAQVRHPDRTLPERTPITIVLTPLPVPHADGWRLDGRLQVLAVADGAPVFGLETAGTSVMEGGSEAELRTWVADRNREGRDVWLAPELGEALALPELEAAAAVVDRLVQEQAVRIEPPPPGELYYQSFIPNPVFRHREGRPAQPWELHLARGPDGEARGHMVRHERDYEASIEQGGRVFKGTLKAEASDPASFRAVLDRDPSDVSVLLVFGPTDLTLRELTAWTRPALSTHPIIFVFPSEP